MGKNETQKEHTFLHETYYDTKNALWQNTTTTRGREAFVESKNNANDDFDDDDRAQQNTDDAAAAENQQNGVDVESGGGVWGETWENRIGNIIVVVV